MSEQPPKPLLNPVLKLTKEPLKKAASGGGKSLNDIKRDRLPAQRSKLANELNITIQQAGGIPTFDGNMFLYISMFKDSMATTWKPEDLFNITRGMRLIVPFQDGYLIEASVSNLQGLHHIIQNSTNPKDMVDISRVLSIRPFSSKEVIGDRSIKKIWESAIEAEGGKLFTAWFMPCSKTGTKDALIRNFINSTEAGLFKLESPDLNQAINDANTVGNIGKYRSLVASNQSDGLTTFARKYADSNNKDTSVSIVVTNESKLQSIILQGSIFRIEPVQKIETATPGEGSEPDRPVPANIASLPVVGIIDGGMSASTYMPLREWEAPKLISNSLADNKHGNQIASLIVHGYAWNNNLNLPQLNCKFGVAQAIPKASSRISITTNNLLNYLDSIFEAHPETNVWNLSFNELSPCQEGFVSEIGHQLSILARKHSILPVVSIGNKEPKRMKPPADCEAAITVGGRKNDVNGNPHSECSVSCEGPGPSNMLKPDISHFSNVRVLGGGIVLGSSFSTALTSSLAAHTFSNLKNPTPDLVKALLIHYSDREAHTNTIGFGSPVTINMPWECKPGEITIQWRASLKPGANYYWELPIPPALLNNGKLKGSGKLTAILNPHPMVSQNAGNNYFGARLETAVQYEYKNKFKNLLGSIEAEPTPEDVARNIDHKWSPTRHHFRKFKAVSTDGKNLRVYARVFGRDLFAYSFSSTNEIPSLEAEFVLTIGTDDQSDTLYNQFRIALGSFVENATIDSDIIVNN